MSKNFPANSRLYPRFPINHPELGYVTKDGKMVGTIFELAYGGLMLTTPTPSVRAVDARGGHGSGIQEVIVVHLFGKSLLCRAEVMHEAKGRRGYRFVHERSDLLPFLKDTIVFLRLGAGRRYLEDHFLDGSPNLPAELKPDDGHRLIITSGKEDAQGVPDVEIQLQVDKVWYKLVRRGDSLNTMHTIWPGARAGDMRQTETLDYSIFRMALASLVGYCTGDYNSVYGKLVQKILDIYHVHLELQVKDLRAKK